jgi:hypothetical protein
MLRHVHAGVCGQGVRAQTVRAPSLHLYGLHFLTPSVFTPGGCKQPRRRSNDALWLVNLAKGELFPLELAVVRWLI